MPERWRTELRRIERLRPDEDLVERATRRPRQPLPPPRGRTKLAIITVALSISAVTAYGALEAFDGEGPAHVGTPRQSGAAATATNGDLLYAVHVEGGGWGWHLFTIDPDSGVEQRLTDGHRDYGSDWSPDGTRIVYDSETPDDTEQGIWVMDADGSDATKIVDDGHYPAWSPDGSTIAFVRVSGRIEVGMPEGGDATFTILAMNADGTDLRGLTSGPDTVWFVTWSPDGTTIAFIRPGAGLFVMNADGSDIHRISAPTLGSMTGLDWSPDGTTIAVSTTGGHDDWSPDGTTIAERHAPDGIAVVPADGSGPLTFVPGTEVDGDGFVTAPAWSPDGRWLAYVDGYGGDIAIVRPDGSDRRTVSVDPGTDTIEELAWGTAATSTTG